jgi:leucyl-tRNA synthetase
VDEDAAREEEIVVPVQVNGKLRDRVVLPANASEEDIKSAALASEAIQKFLNGKPPKKVIVAQKKLVNIVV